MHMLCTATFPPGGLLRTEQRWRAAIATLTVLSIEGTTDAQDYSCPPRLGPGCLPCPDGVWGERGTQHWRKLCQRAAFFERGQGGCDPAGDRHLGALGRLR